VDEGENETSQTTGVPQINPEGNSHNPEGNSHDPEGNINHDNNADGDMNCINDADDSKESSSGNITAMDDDKISIENGSSEDPRITINNINIIEEMNTAQINNNDTNEEAIENNREWTTIANNNRYNLRPSPANRGNMYTLLQNIQQSADVAIPKPHAHFMLAQMNVR